MIIPWGLFIHKCSSNRSVFIRHLKALLCIFKIPYIDLSKILNEYSLKIFSYFDVFFVRDEIIDLLIVDLVAAHWDFKITQFSILDFLF